MIPQNDIFQYIKDAASFRLKLEPWLIDQDFIENGGIIYYAVDTDVVKLYSDPQNNKEYARLFKQDEEKTVEILAWELSRFIFYVLTNEPLLIIPPHHLEIERVINGIARNAEREFKQVLDSLPELEDAIDKYKKNKDLDVLLKLFKHRPFDLINFAFGGKTGYHAELDRITELLTKQRILHIERYVDRRRDRQAALPILQDDIKEEDYNILNDLSLSWIKRLKKTKSKIASYELIADDAEVLARLEWINDELEGEKKKLILISGDPSLHKATGNYLLSSGKTFADNYIRHPTVFLASPDFFTFVSSKSTNSKDEKYYNNRIIKLGLLKWFNVFLAPFVPNHPRFIDRLYKIIQETNKAEREEITETYLSANTENNLKELLSDWQEFINLIGLSSTFVGESGAIIQRIGDIDKEKLRQKIDERATETFEKFLQSATEIGYWSTSASERKKLDQIHDLPVRGVPALRFTLDPVSNYMRKLCLTLQHGPILDQQISFNEIRKQDPSNYSAFVLFSLAFGAAGRWEVSRTLAKYAYDIADNLPPEKQLPPSLEPITGNEAAYLLSWSIRHSAKHVKELKKSVRYIKEAIKRRKEVMKNNSPDVRYEAEFIAIYMTTHFFKIFSDQDCSLEIPSLAQCHIKIIELLKLLHQDVEEEEHVQATVKKQLFVYLFSCALLRHFFDKGLPQEDKEEILNFLCEFRELIEGNSPPVKTCFTYPVYLATCSLFSKDIVRQDNCIIRKKIPNNIDLNAYIQHCSIMPYDKKLYQFLFNIISQN